MSYEDPWDWTKRAQVTPPLSNTLQVQQQPEATPIQQAPHEQSLLGMVGTSVATKALDKGIDKALDKGWSSIFKMKQDPTNIPVVDAVPAPVVNGQVIAPLAAVTPITETAATSAAGETLAGLGAGAAETASVAAPLAEAGATAAAGTEAGMLGALGPIGWGIGGILLAKKLGLFS